MPISSQTVPNWSALERKVLEGGYELEQCLNPTDAAARFKVRILGDRFTQAIADVFAPGAVPRGQIALWQEAATLQHPNLNSPLAVGEVSAEGGQWPYFVRLRPDETLGTVLAERALTVEEARDVTRSVTAALEFLHTHGYVHGGISPEHVLAIGDSVQLSTLFLHRANVPLGSARAGARFRAPESPLENSTAEADIYCLGCALFEVLTGKKVTAESPADPVELPQPFAYIVDHCLDPNPEKRLQLSALQALIEGRQPAQSAVPSEPEIHELAREPVAGLALDLSEEFIAATEHHRVNAVPVEPESTAFLPEPGRMPESEVVTPAKPEASASENSVNGGAAHPPPPRPPNAATFNAPDRIRARREASERAYSRPAVIAAEKRQGEPSAQKPWMWVMLAAIVLGGILWLARPKASTKPQPAVAPATDASRSAATPPIGGASHAVGPDGPASAHTSEPAASSAPVTNQKGKAHSNLADKRVWRVVVWTFTRESDAQRRAGSVRQKHADLNPEVFSPRGHGSPYLVTLGGQMTRPEAERLRQRARSAGLPRDSYIQNYSH